jgi:uncharacterized protein involved in outer membrane biogenesis
MPQKRSHRIAIALILLGAALLALALLWDWNWLRPLIERQASVALGRQVTLRHFDVQMARHPLLVVDGLSIANPPEFNAEQQFATAERLALRIDPWPLFHHELRLLAIDVTSMQGDLWTNPAGHSNWTFTFPKSEGSDTAVEVGNLNISDSTIHIVDPQFKADFTLKLHTEKPNGDGESQLHVEANGTYAGQPISGRFIGGSILSLRDESHPYPVDLEVSNGPTHITLKGTLQRPLQLGGADLDLRLRGNDLAALYPLTGVPLPPTAPYQLRGKLDYTQRRVSFHKFSGTVGSSDLRGNLDVDLSGERRLVTAELDSDKVVLADLAGFIGATPGKAHESAQGQAQADQAKPGARVLPDLPINLPRIRAADLDVRYRGKRIESATMPFDNFSAHFIIRDGYLSVKPLSFGIGRGQIVANVELDGHQNPVRARGDVDFRRVDLKDLVRKSSLVKGTGVVGGLARIDTTGNSLADMLGNGNGDLKLFMHHGELSAVLVSLAGLEFGKALLAALGIPSQTEIRCAVSDFELKQGVLGTRTLLIDTDAANIVGDGNINLRDETLDYRVRTQPKHFGVGSFRAPILVTGSLNDPKVRPDYKTLAARGGAALALGVFLTPLAALLPTIGLGLGEDNDCKALVESLRSAAQAPPVDAKGK